MRRALLQFDEQTYQRLRQRAFRQERSISSVVREIVAKGLEGGTARRRPTQASQFLSVSAGRSKQGRLSPVSERHDDALAASLKK